MCFFFLFEALNLFHCLTGAKKGLANKKVPTQISLFLEDGQTVVLTENSEEENLESDAFTEVLTLIQDDMDDECYEIVWIHWWNN